MNTLCKCGGTIWDGTLICDACHERNKAKARGAAYETMFIVERPMYRVIVIVDGLDVDVQIVLTAKGKRYAAGRARGHHHFMRDDEDALAEIIHARDNYYPVQRPDRAYEALNF